MRHAPLIPLAMVLLMLGACGSPMRQYADTQSVWITTLESAIAARERGYIDRDDWAQQYLPVIREVDAWLDDMGERARAGDREQVSDYAGAIARIAAQIALQIDDAKREDR